jgi:thioredoxin-dependent peroxiredoxin
MKAPAFSLKDYNGNVVTLSSYKGKRVILYFYPAALTPGCTKQACDFTDNLTTLAASGYQVIGISPDSTEKLKEFAAHDHITFPLLSDPDKKVMIKYGAYGEKKLYGKVVMGVIRSTFVIDAQGNIEREFRNVKATGHVAKLMRDLELT